MSAMPLEVVLETEQLEVPAYTTALEDVVPARIRAKSRSDHAQNGRATAPLEEDVRHQVIQTAQSDHAQVMFWHPVLDTRRQRRLVLPAHRDETTFTGHDLGL